MGRVSDSTGPASPQRVAVVIAAHDDRNTIASTVRACYAIPDVDLIVVVDDGSEDDTANAARGAGAVVVRHSVPRGRASALETGVKVVAMRDRVDWPPRHLLFLEPTLGDSALEASALVDAVQAGLADCAIGVVPNARRNGKHRASGKSAYKAIRAATGWSPSDPLSSDRCMTREAVNAIMPFSNGLGVDVAMTVDLISLGFSVVEIPCAFDLPARSVGRRDKHSVPGPRDIFWTVRTKRIISRRVPRLYRTEKTSQEVGVPYQAGPRGSAARKVTVSGTTDEVEVD